MSAQIPTIFFGHGTPMNAIADNASTRTWAAIGARIARPRAILCVSAHWYVRGTAVTAMAHPPTIHDFGGFPQALFDVQYPAPGDPALAARVIELLQPTQVAADERWGLDHGAWSVLCHVYPAADIPVVQLSIDATQPPAVHYELGQRLRPLRHEGVLVMATGGVVHNLDGYVRGRNPEPSGWASRFEAWVRERIEAGDHPALVDYAARGEDARLAVPTPDHYLPLLYVLGAAEPSDAIDFPVAGMEGGSVSMLTVQFG